MSDKNKEIKQNETIKEVSVEDLKKLHETLSEQIKGLEEKINKIDSSNTKVKETPKAPIKEEKAPKEPKKEEKVEKEPVIRDEVEIITSKKKPIVNTGRVIKGVFV